MRADAQAVNVYSGSKRLQAHCRLAFIFKQRAMERKKRWPAVNGVVNRFEMRDTCGVRALNSSCLGRMTLQKIRLLRVWFACCGDLIILRPRSPAPQTFGATLRNANCYDGSTPVSGAASNSFIPERLATARAAALTSSAWAPTCGVKVLKSQRHNADKCNCQGKRTLATRNW